MNWQKQMEDLVSGWTESQRRLFDQWMEAVKGVVPGAEEWQKEYHRQLDSWERAVRDGLARQEGWTGGGGQGAVDPETAERWLGQVQQMMQGWIEAQIRLWSTWMEQARQLQQTGELPWQQGTREAMDAWQDMARQGEQATTGAVRGFEQGAGSEQARPEEAKKTDGDKPASRRSGASARKSTGAQKNGAAKTASGRGGARRSTSTRKKS